MNFTTLTPIDDEEDTFVTPPLRTPQLPAPINPEPVQPFTRLTPIVDTPTGPTGEPTGPSPFTSLTPLADDEEVAPTASPEEPVKLSADDIRNNPARMKVVRDYMVQRKGAQFRDMDDDEVYDKYVNHMRFFNVNEVTTIGELRWLNSQEDKGVATEAYTLFDSLGNVLTNDGVLGAIDGITDYARGVFTSPSTYIGAGLGRIVAGSATAAGRTAAIQAASKEARQAAAKAAGTTLRTTAGKKAADEAAGQLAAAAARSTVLKQAAIATTFDASAGSLQDYLYQTTLLNSGAQEEYSVLQTGFAALGGIVGGAVSYLPNVSKASGLADTAGRVTAAEQKRAADAYKRAKPEIKKAAAKFQEDMADWLKMAENGQRVVKDDNELMVKATQMLLDTDPNSQTSIVAAMMRAGYGLKSDVPSTAQIASFAVNLPKKELAELDASFRATVGIPYTDFVDIMVQTSRQAGQVGNLTAQAANALAKTITARQMADGTIVGLTEEAGKKAAKKASEAPSPEVIKYTMSLWRRALVSHPATTAVNIQGWAQAFAARSLSETIHGGILMSAGLVAKMASPVSAKSGQWGDEALRKSQHLFQAQAFKLKTLFDPYTTRESAEALFAQMSKGNQNKLGDSVFGGVSDKGPERYGMNPKGGVVRNAERISNRAATISGVKLQDMYTKSFSVLGELDKQLRLQNNMSLEQTIAQGKVGEISDDIFSKAVEVGLRDTFSADYTKGKGTFSQIAKFVEAVSNTPYVGFLFPFGRFLNNNLAFVMQYSPVALVPMASKMRTKGYFGGDDFFDSLSKITVGTTALATLAAMDKEKQEQGLAWYEEMQSTGDIVDRQNLAPGAVYKVAGRIASLLADGQQVSQDLWRELGDQLGPSKILREASQNPLDETIRYLQSVASDDADRRDFGGFIGEVLKVTLGDIGSGFTRPLEPLNVAVGVATDRDVLTDRRQLRGPDAVIKGAMRYVDNIFAPFIGDRTEDGGYVINPARQDATRPGPQREANPVARLLGDRVSGPQTDIDVMLRKVNIAPWTVQERTGVPEWDALMNEKITPMLDMRARQMMDSALWKQGSVASKERMARALLREVKSEVKTFIEKEGGVSDIILKKRQEFTRLPESLRKEAKRFLGISASDDELTPVQMEMLQVWIKDRRAMEEEPNK